MSYRQPDAMEEDDETVFKKTSNERKWLILPAIGILYKIDKKMR